MGNPHCVFVVNDVDSVDLLDWGSRIESHELFPQKQNVEFIQIIDKQNIRQRTFERGVGETLACGSGACAARRRRHCLCCGQRAQCWRGGAAVGCRCLC